MLKYVQDIPFINDSISTTILGSLSHGVPWLKLVNTVDHAIVHRTSRHVTSRVMS